MSINLIITHSVLQISRGFSAYDEESPPTDGTGSNVERNHGFAINCLTYNANNNVIIMGTDLMNGAGGCGRN